MLKSGEYYFLRTQARQRRGQINHEGRALIVSIEEVLYPLSAIVVKYSTQQGVSQPPLRVDPLPATPPPNRLLEPFTSVEDAYDREKAMKARP